MAAVAIATGVSAAASIGTGIASATSQSSAASESSKQSALSTTQQLVNSGLAASQARADYNPYMTSGTSANALLSGLLGLSTASTLTAPNVDNYKTYAMIGGKYQAITDWTAYSQALQDYNSQKATLTSLQNSGQLGSLLTPFGESQYKNDPGYTPMVNDTESLRQTPGYQWQLGQGLQAVNNSAAAKGSLLSGATMKSLNNYAQGLADTTYQSAWNRAQTAYSNAFNRYTTNQNNIYSRLSGMTSTGLSAAQSNTSAALNSTSQQNSALQSNANAQSQAAYNSANATSSGLSSVNSGINTALSNYLLGNYLSNKSGGSSNNSNANDFSSWV